MEPHTYTLPHKACAGILALGGVFWGMLLISSLILPPLGIMYNAIFTPGWIIFFGWCYILVGRSINMNTRLFWVLSALVNTIYLILHYGSWLTRPSSDKIVMSMEVWWIITILVSLFCSVLRPAEQDILPIEAQQNETQ